MVEVLSAEVEFSCRTDITCPVVVCTTVLPGVPGWYKTAGAAAHPCPAPAIRHRQDRQNVHTLGVRAQLAPGRGHDNRP